MDEDFTALSRFLAAPVSTVVGYHATGARVAKAILAGRPFRSSRNPYDWLGTGVYFWEAAPNRAWEWAHRPVVLERLGPDIALVGARIRLERCLDFHDTAWHTQIDAIYEFLLARFVTAGRPLPSQTPTGWHGWDKAVIDFLAEQLYQQQRVRLGVVRASFREPDDVPIFPGSGLYRGAHVQVAVRDQSLIEERWLERGTLNG